MPSSVRFKSAANLAWQFALLVGIAFAVLGLRPGQVSGESMEPRIASDEYVLINAFAFRFGGPHRGEIVAFRHERRGPTVYIKRIVGVPGDRVAIDRGVVVVNGTPLDEPYVRYRDARSFPPVVVPAARYYVLGDNRSRSEDSRSWGFVPAEALVGRAIFGVWPLSRAGKLH